MSKNTAEIIEGLMLKGQSSLRQGKLPEAFDHFSQVISLDPENKEVFQFRAEALLRMGEKSKAEQDLDQQESPAATVRKLLSQANEFINNRSFDDAERAILKANLYEGTDRQRTDAALMLGVLYAVTERYEEAKIQYKLAQTSMPEDDRYVANIIGLNALIRLRELAQSPEDDFARLKVEVARDYIHAHDDIIPGYTPGQNLMAKIAVSITAGDFDAAERKLWTSISSNMDTNALTLSQSALSSNSCRVSTGLPIINNKLNTVTTKPNSEKGATSFTKRELENPRTEPNAFSASAA